MCCWGGGSVVTEGQSSPNQYAELGRQSAGTGNLAPALKERLFAFPKSGERASIQAYAGL